MDNKEYWLVVSTVDIEPSIYTPIIDPLNLKPFSEPLLVSAKNEEEAFSKLIKSDLYKQYNNEHHSSALFFYCKEETESVYHKVNGILLDFD